MDPALQAAIQNSTVLTDEMRQKLNAAADRLTPDQVQRIVASIEAAEAQKKQVVEEGEAQKQEVAQKYVAEMRQLQKEAPMKAMHAAEEVDHQKEEAELENILSELDNV